MTSGGQHEKLDLPGKMQLITSPWLQQLDVSILELFLDGTTKDQRDGRWDSEVLSAAMLAQAAKSSGFEQDSSVEPKLLLVTYDVDLTGKIVKITQK